MRFVVLFHQTPPGYPRADHWDFMLEAAGGLRTWALPAAPAAGQTLVAEQLADHRAEYLSFEGPLSGERGSVTQWDAGTYDTLAVTEERWLVRLVGQHLAGVVCLERLDGGPGQAAAQRWTFAFSAGEAISG